MTITDIVSCCLSDSLEGSMITTSLKNTVSCRHCDFPYSMSAVWAHTATTEGVTPAHWLHNPGKAYNLHTAKPRSLANSECPMHATESPWWRSGCCGSISSFVARESKGHWPGSVAACLHPTAGNDAMCRLVAWHKCSPPQHSVAVLCLSYHAAQQFLPRLNVTVTGQHADHRPARDTHNSSVPTTDLVFGAGCLRCGTPSPEKSTWTCTVATTAAQGHLIKSGSVSLLS